MSSEFLDGCSGSSVAAREGGGVDTFRNARGRGSDSPLFFPVPLLRARWLSAETSTDYLD